MRTVYKFSFHQEACKRMQAHTQHTQTLVDKTVCPSFSLLHILHRAVVYNDGCTNNLVIILCAQAYRAQHGLVCILLLWQIQQECQASIEEDGETLVIEGFRFESAASREDLRRLSSQAGAGGRQGDTWLMATLVVSSHKVSEVKWLAEVTMADREATNNTI